MHFLRWTFKIFHIVSFFSFFLFFISLLPFFPPPTFEAPGWDYQNPRIHGGRIGFPFSSFVRRRGRGKRLSTKTAEFLMKGGRYKNDLGRARKVPPTLCSQGKERLVHTPANGSHMLRLTLTRRRPSTRRPNSPWTQDSLSPSPPPFFVRDVGRK